MQWLIMLSLTKKRKGVIDMTIDEAIAHAREVAKDKRKEMQCKTCKLFARSDLHPLQGYCRKNKFHSIEIDSWRKVCSEYVPKEMCKCAEEHEQLAEWLEELKEYRKHIELTEIPEQYKLGFQDGIVNGFENGYNKAIDDFAEKLNAKCDGMIKEEWNSNVAPISWAEAYADFKDDIDEIAEQLKERD